MIRRSGVPLALLMVRVADPGVGGPWALFGACCCFFWLGTRWVALLAFVRQSCWRLW